MKISYTSSLLLYSIIVSLFSASVSAQTTSSDLWFSSTFKYKIVKNLDVKVEFGHRRENFYSSRLYGDFILKYSFSKYAKVAVGWRHAGESDPLNLDEITDRFHVDFSGKMKQKDLSLNYRIRYQQKFENWSTDSKGFIPNNSFRSRLLLEYKLNKDWSFDIGPEIFYQLSNSEPIFIDKLRLIAGTEYQINKSQSIAVHYIRQQEVQVRNPHTSHIVSIDYSVDIKQVIKRVKKKKRKESNK